MNKKSRIFFCVSYYCTEIYTNTGTVSIAESLRKHKYAFFEEKMSSVVRQNSIFGNNHTEKKSDIAQKRISEKLAFSFF